MENYYENSKLNTADIVEKESVISRELGILTKSTTELSMQLDVLEQRLGVVLQAQPKSANTDIPEEQLTALADTIRSNRRQVDEAIYSIRSILDRLEL